MMYISDEEKQKFPFNSSMDTETLNFSELSSDTEGNHIVLTIHQVTVSLAILMAQGVRTS